jgi:uncharacterized membrane-anchored protein
MSSRTPFKLKHPPDLSKLAAFTKLAGSRRPAYLWQFAPIAAPLLILTALLLAMIASRVSLLENGVEVVLKTAPIDPRDLLRGYYVRLAYDISRIDMAKLQNPLTKQDLNKGFKRRSLVFVRLRPDNEGYWSPVSLHHQIPTQKGARKGQNKDVFIRGRVSYSNCPASNDEMKTTRCRISIRYGIEKYFTNKKRARELEITARQSNPEIVQLQMKIDKMRKKYRQELAKSRWERKNNSKSDKPPIYSASPQAKKLKQQISDLRWQQRKLQQNNRQQMAKRFAVIVRIDRKSGEAAISGLRINGRKVYDEGLF